MHGGSLVHSHTCMRSMTASFVHSVEGCTVLDSMGNTTEDLRMAADALCMSYMQRGSGISPGWP